MNNEQQTKINVYAIHAYGYYGGGMAVVAAHDEEEAKSLATGLDQHWDTSFDEPDSIELLPVEYNGEARVLSWFATGD